MTRDTGVAVDDDSGVPVGSVRDGAEASQLVDRLAIVERAYSELLQRVRRYERERAELKHRLASLMAQLDVAVRADVTSSAASFE
jgi:hypothetical protein